MARMRVLSSNEQDTFDKPPLFDRKRRKRFLTLSKGLMDIAKGLRTPNSHIGFVLMCGYFKATKRFYQPQDFYIRDIESVIRTLELSGSNFSSLGYTKQTSARHQSQILNFYGFTAFDGTAINSLSTEVATMARMHLKPRLIFDRCVELIINHRVQAPSSYRLSDLICIGGGSIS